MSSTHGTPYLTTPEWILVFAAARPTADASRVGQVLIVGDSLTVGNGPELEARLGSSVRIDAAAGRSSAAGVEVLRERLLPEDDTVVFDLGTNDDPERAQQLADSLRRARDLAGDRCLVVATVNRPESRPLNNTIRDFVDRSNVVLYDWHRIAQSEQLLGPDGIHPTPDGYRRRAAGELEAIAAC